MGKEILGWSQPTMNKVKSLRTENYAVRLTGSAEFRYYELFKSRETVNASCYHQHLIKLHHVMHEKKDMTS